MASWHAEVTLVQLRLRRYAGSDAAAAFATHEPFDAVASAEVRRRAAWLDGMLVAGAPLSREDRRQIAQLLRMHGAVELHADRHGRLISLDR
jgi:hypothetical protein